MAAIDTLITDHLDLWTAALKRKSTAGRGSSSKVELYGIKKLRELILELAVRGLLVPQDPNDEPASELLKKIAAEKAKLVKEGKIKKEKPLPAIAKENIPSHVPSGWAPARLGTLFISINSGGTPSKSNPGFWGGDIPWASVKDLGVKREIKKTQDSITEVGLRNGSRLADVGDLLICTRMGLGKIAVVKIPMAYNQDLKSVKLTTFCDVDFFLNAYATLKIKGKGTTVEGIKQDQLLDYFFLLPPLAEQHRIVAKVDELMALCDQLEQQTDASLGAHQTLVETLLSALTSTADHTQFASSWQRIAGHFDTLFTTEESIAQLKQTILQLAVMGKLVPQDPNDEPASELLKKIAAEKAKLVKEGKIKADKPLTTIGIDEKPFEVPTAWEFVRLRSLSSEIGTGPFGSMIHQSDYVEGGIPLINPSHMINDLIVEEAGVAVSQEKAKELSSYRLHSGDIVLARRGEVGRCAIVTDRENGWLCGTGSFYLRLSADISRRFMALFFRASSTRDYLVGNAVGTTMVNLNHGILNNLPIALPPLAEQHRIVAKVDELMALCDQLKSRLADAQTTQLHLADALVEQAIG